MHTLEEHEAQMPNCQDPDCEFHHPVGSDYMDAMKRDQYFYDEAQAMAEAADYGIHPSWDN